MRSIVLMLVAMLLVGCAQAQSSPLQDSYWASDPSQARLDAFLANVNFSLDPSEHSCGHYAISLHNQAEAEGIRAAVVIGDGHACNAFLVDGAVIYVDATAGHVCIGQDDGLVIAFEYTVGPATYRQVVHNDKIRIEW